jgi:tetratricopeptide (TPR) repeat protein
MAGAEGAFGPVRLRAGYRFAMGGEAAQNQSGVSAGAGFKVSYLRLDYSFNPYGELSSSHRLQATLELPRDFFQARVAAPEGTSMSAKAFFARAEELEHQGEPLKALIQYQRGVESYPQELKASPQNFYVAALAKIDELQAKLNKGDSAEIQKLSKESLAAAQWEIKAGRFKEAITRLEQAQSIDPKNDAISYQLNEARKGLEEKLDAFRVSARAAWKRGSLAQAVAAWRKLLLVEPGDAEALGFMDAQRKSLKVLLQEAERKGIFSYVGGKLNDAIRAWKEGEQLDYFGDVDFRRNIDKAVKQLETGTK